jgi:hypothetical protein
MTRRRLSPASFIAVAETVGSGDALNSSGDVGLLRSRMLAINSPIIASGKPRKIKATKAPIAILSTGPPDFAFFPLHFNRPLVEQKVWGAKGWKRLWKAIGVPICRAPATIWKRLARRP